MLNQHVDEISEAEIDREYQRQLYRRAAESVRRRADETTWLAFSMTMVDGDTIAETAQRLNRTEAVVYAARSRIMRRLRDAVRDLEDEE
jgi:RNA polymerase sigma-70 factor (ECF subfamily)